MDTQKLIETYVNADYSDKQTLERLLGKEVFTNIDDYEILYYYLPSLSNKDSYHTQNAECFNDPQFGGNEEWKIYSIKRLYDNKVFSIGDFIQFNSNHGKDKATLLEIEFEIAPCDKGTRKLCFVSDHEIIGKWWTISQLEHTTRPLFTTDDDVEIFVDTPFYYVNEEYLLCTNNGKPFTALNDVKIKGYKYFYDKTNALDYIKLHELCLSVKRMLVKQSYHCYSDLVKDMF